MTTDSPPVSWVHNASVTNGTSGCNNTLGSAIVGRRVWNVESCFVLNVGPLSFRDHLTFLPGGSRHAPFVALTRFFVGETLEAVVSVLAVIILLMVTNWVFHKFYWVGWNAKLRSLSKASQEATSERLGLLVGGVAA